MGRNHPPAPFIVGVGRSGTTLLRLMLDAHPELAIPPETGFIPMLSALKKKETRSPEAFYRIVTSCAGWIDFNLSKEDFYRDLLRLEKFTLSEGVRCFYLNYAGRFHKTRWGDKTPVYGLHMPSIEKLLPEARFIHIIRDGRDVALSLRGLWFSPGDDTRSLATYWFATVRDIRQNGQRCRHYLEVRYEDLVAEPKKELERISKFIELPYTESMEKYYELAQKRLDEVRDRYDEKGNLLITKEGRLALQRWTNHPPDVSRINRWKREMKDEEKVEFESIAGHLLRQLGYQTLSLG